VVFAWLGFVGSGKLGLGVVSFVNLFTAWRGEAWLGLLWYAGVWYGFYL